MALVFFLPPWLHKRNLRWVPAMRVPILLTCCALTVSSAHSESLSDADRETLLENLEKLRESADAKVDARFRIALAAYRNAISSDDAAIDLYLNCLEKVNFEDQQRKAADFREWKRKESEKLSDPGLRLALRHQLRWLMLTLEAASEKADRVKLGGDAKEIVDAIFRDPSELEGQEAILNQAVTSSVFARAYDINHVKVEKWPLSPVELASIYDEILLPPFRNAARLAGLRTTWISRIQYEIAKIEHFSGSNPPAGGEDRDEKRVGMVDAMRSPEYVKFLEEEVPKLQWKMEVDLFTHGDESGAAVRMLAHLEKHIAHPSAREWSDELQKKLKRATPVTPPNPAETPP